MLLHTLVTDELRRLDDEAEDYWQRAEMENYSRDGYDEFCRRTGCVFDLVVIENTPPVGDYGSDLTRYLAEHTPGMAIADRRVLFTQPGERDLLGAPVAAGDALAIDATDPSQASGTVPGGRLPDGVLSVLSVSWDQKTLDQETAQSLRQKDQRFETVEGDPQAWLWGEDGLMQLRVWPVAAGDASYDTYSGEWGIETYADDGVTEDECGLGGYGLVSEATDEFPSGGPWGFEGRLHPELKNIVVAVARLGRDPQVYPLEIPRSFLKYIAFYAMAQALKHEGPGQDLKLAQHFLDRFEFGVSRMEERLRAIQPERRGQIGSGDSAGGGVNVSLPAYWGYVRRR